VLRLLGTDRLVNNLVTSIPGGDIVPVAAVLAVIGLCAFVLDAFEIIFVVLPIVIPPLLVRVADARWVAVLVLLTLQSSFLLPPFGYALMMVRGALKPAAPFKHFLRALAPFLLAQWLLLAAVLLMPRLVHVMDNAQDNTRSPTVPISKEEIDKRLNDMVPLPPLPAIGD
ncbi:MAG: TRAP transporter large permease subunit, partial [Pseudolabrys sp.]|nr:TRAP transporter large permease subunit [Pseudolabrys sp.]